MRIPIEKILSPDTDHRPVDGKFVGELTERIQAGAKTLPATMFCDAEGKHWLADGFYRLWASRRAGLGTLECNVFPGTKEDAISYRDGALAAQGRR